MLYAIAVNYGTADVIHDWATSILQEHPDSCLYLVDNFKSDADRQAARVACEAAHIRMIESENVGYGRGLDVGLAMLLSEHEIASDDLIVFGNIDLSLSNVTVPASEAAMAYMPIVLQDGAPRNPFLTHMQRRFVRLYDIAAVLRSPKILRLASGVIKLIGKLPSRAYATHGSLFVLNGAGLQAIPKPVFNEETFLYCEEMEFAEAVRAGKIGLIHCDIEVKHIGKVSTGAVTQTNKAFFDLWYPSWRNWRKRW